MISVAVVLQMSHISYLESQGIHKLVRNSSLRNASWLYEDFEGDEDDIFNNGPGADHGRHSSPSSPSPIRNKENYQDGGLGGANACNDDNMKATTESAKNVDL